VSRARGRKATENEADWLCRVILATRGIIGDIYVSGQYLYLPILRAELVRGSPAVFETILTKHIFLKD